MIGAVRNIPAERKSLIWYACYILGITILFLFIRFPGDMVRDFLEKGSQRLYPGLKLDVSQAAGLSPFLWITMDDCTFYYQDSAVLQAEKLQVRPSLGILLGRSAGSFRLEVFAGVIRGQCRQSAEGNMRVEGRFAGIQLESIPLPDGLSPYALSGTGKGDFRLDTGDDAIPEGAASFVFTDGQVRSASPLFGLEMLTFEAVEAALTLASDKVTLERFSLTGPQITGTFSGVFVLRQPFRDSRLDISGFVKPHSSLIAKLGESFPVEFFVQKNPDSKGFPVKIAGMAAQPEFSMQD